MFIVEWRDMTWHDAAWRGVTWRDVERSGAIVVIHHEWTGDDVKQSHTCSGIAGFLHVTVSLSFLPS